MTQEEKQLIIDALTAILGALQEVASGRRGDLEELAEVINKLADAETDDAAYHVMPQGDLREHDSSPECWCEPRKQDDANVWVHKSMDGREAFEAGARQPS